MTPIKILVTNQKGGVGKSTISANLAAFFALKRDIKTAFIDFDKQSSSSNWLKKAANFGIEIHQAQLQSQNNSGLLLLDAKAVLRECSKAAELVIADLTWTYTLPPQFLMEFDIVIVPSSISRVEMVSSEIFVLEYLQKRLAIAGKKHQIIIMAPSRIDAGQSTEGIFPFVSANGNCFISPPIEKVSDIDQYYFGSFLCEAQDERVAKNFCEFGSYIYEKYCALVMPYQSIHSGVSSSISSYRQEQLKPPVLASGGQNSASASSTMPLKNERLGRKVVDLFIPQFLRTKSPIDNSKGE